MINLAIIEELNEAVSNGSLERRTEVLQRVTDLFAFGAESYSGDQISLFDDVFTSLVSSIEVSARAALAKRLCKIIQSPPAISRTLASDQAISVAGPMLENFEGLDNDILVEQARTKSQDHLLAISKRKSLNAKVTDVLAERGGKPVMLSIAGNPGAAFSEAGYTALVKRSHGDDELTTCVGLRRDIPRHHLLRLLVRASHAVRVQLDAAQLMVPSAVRGAVADAVREIQSQRESRNYAAARAEIAALKAAGKLNEADVEKFASEGKFEQTVAALAALIDLPIELVEHSMVHDRSETILIVAKAIGLSWTTVKQLLKLRAGEPGISSQDLELCLGIYTRLKSATAQRVIDFQRRRSSAD